MLHWYKPTAALSWRGSELALVVRWCNPTPALSRAGREPRLKRC